MSKEQSIEIIIYGNKIRLSTDSPEEMTQIAFELDAEITAYAKNLPSSVKHNTILAMSCLKYYEKSVNLLKELHELKNEKEKIADAVHGLYKKIEI